NIWNAVKARFGGIAESKKMRKSMLKQKFSEFRIGEAKGLHKRALPSSWSQVALTLKTKGGLEFLSFDNLYYKLKTLENNNWLYEDFEQTEKLNLEEMDLKWKIDMLSSDFRGVTDSSHPVEFVKQVNRKWAMNSP
nr:hypothetical protein [Tanacetum cinerariifolium]